MDKVEKKGRTFIEDLGSIPSPHFFKKVKSSTVVVPAEDPNRIFSRMVINLKSVCLNIYSWGVSLYSSLRKVVGE